MATQKFVVVFERATSATLIELIEVEGDNHHDQLTNLFNSKSVVEHTKHDLGFRKLNWAREGAISETGRQIAMGSISADELKNIIG